MPWDGSVGERQHERGQLAGESGQTLVEFALVLPILLILVLGVVDLGKALGYKNDQTNLANQAARLAVVSSGTSCTPCSGSQNIAQYIISTAPGELQNGTGSISKRTETGFTNNGLYVSFFFPNISSSTCQTQISSGTACGYCKGDPVQVTALSTYNFLSFLVGQGTLPLKRDMSSSATMRMETNYNNAAGTSYVNGFVPTNNMSGLPASTTCP